MHCLGVVLPGSLVHPGDISPFSPVHVVKRPLVAFCFVYLTAAMFDLLTSLSLSAWFGTALPIAFVAYWVGWIVYARTLHPLARIPGPFWASISRTWYIAQLLRGDMEKTQRRLHAEHGPLIRIAPNEIACADPTAIKQLYPTQNPLKKSDWYTVWGNPNISKHDDLFSETSEKAHGERRRIVNNVYTLSNVLKSEKYIDKCSALFCQRLGEHIDAKQPFDLSKWAQW